MDPINGNPKTAPLALHGILLYPWNTNFEINKSMQKRTKIGKMQ
jgi:hypothetical protein